MKSSLPLTVLATAIATATASAQAPLFIPLSADTAATDVAITSEIIVVGTVTITGSSPILRWTYATGENVITLPGGGSGASPHISSDGTRILATDLVAGNEQASYYNGTTWTPVPGLPGALGGVKSLGDGISANGNFIVGMGYSAGNVAHPFKWNQATGLTTDLQPFFSSPQSRAFDVDSSGNTVVGWEDVALRLGTRWVGGVKTAFTYTDPNNVVRNVGEARAVNDAGTIVVGNTIFGSPAISAAWRWDAGTNAITPLPNVVGATSTPIALDVSEDGSVIVGTASVPPFTNNALIWINDQPQDLYTYMNSLGIQGMSGFTSLGPAYAVSPNGKVIVGGGAASPGNPNVGWIIVFPDAVPLGTVYCNGDGSGVACPCGNASAVGANEGCTSSLGVAGLLRGAGQASVTADSAKLIGGQIPNGPGLYFQGTAQLNGGAGLTFGDGLRCVGGTVIRLGIVQGVGNASTYPSPNPPAANQIPISLKGLVAAGDVRHYQLWYRDSATFCSGAVFNLTNGLSVTWQP